MIKIHFSAPSFDFLIKWLVAWPVRSGQLNIGPFAIEPINEADLAVSGQGTDDDFANMTLDFGFTCSALASTGTSQIQIALIAAGFITTASAATLYATKKTVFNS
ncbi:MAG TPA: hypothetical protein VD907_06285 [Verrucomicrobiae bacterium]|nr:hypothetical protein [Verrucomicrobiae bacterium]